MTRNNICYNLDESPFTCADKDLIYFFSSLLHLKKFKSKKLTNRVVVSESLSKRFKMTVKVDLLSDILLYSQIESRGFLIWDYKKGGIYKCLNHITLDGLTMTPSNLPMLSDLSTQKLQD